MVLKYKKAICIISKKQTFSTGTASKKWLTSFESLSISLVKLCQSSSFNYLYMVLNIHIFSILRDKIVKIKLKWPNDMFLVKIKYLTLSKKAIGILMFFGMLKKKVLLVIGIGININIRYSPFKYIYNRHITVLFYRYNIILFKKYICKYLLIKFSRKLTRGEIKYYLNSHLNKKNKMVVLRNHIFFYVYDAQGCQKIEYSLIIDITENNVVISLNSRYMLKYLRYLKIQHVS